MMRFDVELRSRNFARTLTVPGLTLSSETLAWTAMGGCERAVIRATGGELALWNVANLLRCPVTVRNESGEAAWWGYVSEAQIQVGRWQLQVNLDSMANRIAVAYEEVAAGQDGAGTRATTDYAEDLESIGEYGYFERLEPLTYATLDMAEDHRERALMDQRFPVPSMSYSGSIGMEATLTCLGWWQSLQYRYYSHADGAEADAQTIAEEIVDTAGQWLTAQHWEDDLSANTVSQYRDGDTNALAEIEELLSVGSDSATPRRVLPYVTESRAVIFKSERVFSGVEDVMVDSEAQFRDAHGARLPLGPRIVGRWCRINDVIPAAASMLALADPTRVWIERAEYDCDSGALHTEGRGASAWELGGWGIR